MNILFIVHNRKQIEHVFPTMEYMKAKKHNVVALFIPNSANEPWVRYVIKDDRNVIYEFQSLGFLCEYMKVYSFKKVKVILSNHSINRILMVQANTVPSRNVFFDIKSENIKIPILAQQCSIITPEDINWYGDTWCGDLVAAHSEYSKSEMVRRRGIDPSIIEVTGSPKFDLIKSLKTKDSKTILFIGQRDFSTGSFKIVTEKVTDLLSFLMLSLPSDYKLLIKEHPNTFRKGNFKRLLKKTLNKPAFRVLKGRMKTILVGDTTELIKNASLVITVYSNCGLESMVMGRPTVILNICPYSEMLYNGSGVITNGFHNFIELCHKVMDGNYENLSVNNFVQKMVFIDGCASKRITNLLKNM